jgi:site-specific DNA-methyltransferase (adenine-specific)
MRLQGGLDHQCGDSGYANGNIATDGEKHNPQGRFPANLIHDGSQEVLDLFPETSKSSKRPPTGKPKYTGTDGDSNAMKGSSTIDNTVRGHSDNGGSAARFFKSINDLDDVPETDFGNIRAFYCPKASKKDRNEGCEELKEKKHSKI